ncbi:low temperature requirement A protein (LtrA) [Actinokineospora iranica]|uniref:Low temperature requirement A protein (LtrA) n=1 Tax=Actinokineospora iranica TaxID=1271860 RepID=A0A1G6JGE5_9PSEU|nr:low temperature requirement A protein (LtrA) [Actinokineospora iranica]
MVAYFDTHALIAERALARATGVARTRLARSAFSFLHLPLIVGVVMLALGLKKVLGYVGGADGHTAADHLHGPPLWELFGGTALYLVAHAAISWRCARTVKVQRLVLGAVLVAITPLMALVSALAAEEHEEPAEGSHRLA